MATSTDLRSAIEEVQQSLPAGQAGEQQSLLGQDGIDRLTRRLGALPWWVISAATHAVLFLLIALLAVAVPAPISDEVVISTEIAKAKPPEYDPTKQRDIFRRDTEIKSDVSVDHPIVSHDKTQETDTPQTDNHLETSTPRGSETGISDLPIGGTGFVGSMGVDGGGMSGVFGYRDGGGRKRATGRFGGSAATESAVEAALRWLSCHQEPDGHWDCGKYDGSEKKNGDVGVTGLALLAFLGAGYTEKVGPFIDNVRRAEQWLVKQQKPDGAITYGAGGDGRLGYNHAIAGLALAEAYGMSRSPELQKAAQKAVDYSIKEHQAAYSGWRYHAREAADTSVTGWFVMQLKSAKIAGLTVDGAGFQGASNFLETVTDKEGHAGYITKSSNDSAMTAVGMVCRLFMGAPANDPMLVGGAKLLSNATPQWQDKRNIGRERGFYYWYYGTLAMFQVGGDNWKKWNESLKPTLLNNQCKANGQPLDGSKEDKDGSWDASSWIDPYGGRVFTTALGALTLEVYYRYLPMYSK